MMPNENGSEDHLKVEIPAPIISTRLNSKSDEKKSSSNSTSSVTKSPPAYDNVCIQAPPSYKDIFPSFFRTFSLAPAVRTNDIEVFEDNVPPTATPNTNPNEIRGSFLNCWCNDKCIYWTLGLLTGIALVLLFTYNELNSKH